MQYVIITEHTKLELTCLVNKHIKEGWWPLGGAALDVNNCYFQTIIKGETQEETERIMGKSW